MILMFCPCVAGAHPCVSSSSLTQLLLDKRPGLFKPGSKSAVKVASSRAQQRQAAVTLQSVIRPDLGCSTVQLFLLNSKQAALG